MAWTPRPKRLVTTVTKVEFQSIQHAAHPAEGDGRVYRVHLLINGVSYVEDIVLYGHGFSGGDLDVCRPLKHPKRVIGDIVRRFDRGELLEFPLELGDIGKV